MLGQTENRGRRDIEDQAFEEGANQRNTDGDI